MSETATRAAFNVESVRAEFPILARSVYEKPLIYLDSAASAQKPQSVIDAESRVYDSEYANVHRGAHYLSAAATDAFEAARSAARAFVNAATDEEIVFTRGATEAINLVAQSYGDYALKAGDRILLTELEHLKRLIG
ncbi:MAG: aminotransferase class V-fold PLP-dependent enzyme [Pseudomonadota bacterium]